jgi:hypothetical protein
VQVPRSLALSPTPVAVSGPAWLELLHAECAWVLKSAEIDALVIKGPGLGQWLYPEGRESVDVDLLVRPRQWDGALSVLRARGFVAARGGLNPDEAAPHSVDLRRDDATQGRHVLDLHRFFPGVERDPDGAFEALWQRRTAGSQAGMPVWLPDQPSQALLVALHAARGPKTKTADDLERAMTSLDQGQLDDLAALTQQLDASVALKAGLETDPALAWTIGRLRLGDVEVTRYWALASRRSDSMATDLERFRAMTWPERATRMRHWMVPSRTTMTLHDPRAAGGGVALARAHVVRWGQRARRLPGAVRQWQQARRGSGG